MVLFCMCPTLASEARFASVLLSFFVEEKDCCKVLGKGELWRGEQGKSLR
jgi:hypothetical protein